MTSPSPFQLYAGITLFLGTSLAVLAATVGSDPLAGMILVGGSLLTAWTIATQGERWRAVGRSCAMRRGGSLRCSGTHRGA